MRINEFIITQFCQICLDFRVDALSCCPASQTVFCFCERPNNVSCVVSVLSSSHLAQRRNISADYAFRLNRMSCLQQTTFGKGSPACPISSLVWRFIYHRFKVLQFNNNHDEVSNIFTDNVVTHCLTRNKHKNTHAISNSAWRNKVYVIYVYFFWIYLAAVIFPMLLWQSYCRLLLTAVLAPREAEGISSWQKFLLNYELSMLQTFHQRMNTSGGWMKWECSTCTVMT